MVKGNNNNREGGSRFRFLTRRHLWQRLLLGGGLFVVILAILFYSVLPDRVSLEKGMPSPKTIYAHWETIDHYTTNLKREEAAAAVLEAFDYKPDVQEDITGKFNAFMGRIYQIRQMEEGQEEKVRQLERHFPFQLEESAAGAILTVERGDLDELARSIRVIIHDIMEQGIKEGGLENARKQFIQEVNLLPYPNDLKDSVAAQVSNLMRPNMIYNEEATLQSREQARQEVEPARILKGSLIISEGETVTERHLAQLDSLGLQDNLYDYSILLGLVLLLLAIFIMSGFYLYSYEKELFYNPMHLLLLGFIVIITLVFTLAASFFSGYLAPVAMGIILITVLFNYRLAILMNVVLAIFIGIIMGGDFRFIVVALLGGLTAVYSVTRLNQRSDLTRAGLYIALVNTLVIASVFLFLTGFRLEYELVRSFSLSLLSGIGNGLFSAVMAIGLLPYLENGFSLTTAVSLLEMANPNQPLLKELLMKAPGTYHHSIIVANLAEAAAELVRGDPLLSRVGAYYHDIGKTRRPYFFIENQLTNANPHDKMTASLSTLIITAHVKDGLEMAREEKLPQAITDIIQQHHGTSLISYFYHRATEQEKKEGLREENFRYEGPRPQTREAAIIMLADSVEAAVRSMSKPTAGRVEGLVRKIIKEKLNDGQLDESDLTLKDLDKIAGAFSKILTGIFHSRVEYPEKELKMEIERGKVQDGVVHKSPEPETSS